jgi:hypothetical protein
VDTSTLSVHESKLAPRAASTKELDAQLVRGYIEREFGDYVAMTIGPLEIQKLDRRFVQGHPSKGQECDVGDLPVWAEGQQNSTPRRMQSHALGQRWNHERLRSSSSDS